MITRSTQRAQTSLAEADHYSHIAHCKNVEPWLWKTTLPLKKGKMILDHYLHHDLGVLPLLGCFFAHLLILQYPDHHQNLISSSLYYSGPVHKISSQSVHNFLSNVVHRQTNKQTDRQTNQRYQKHNLLCQGGNNEDSFSSNDSKVGHSDDKNIFAADSSIINHNMTMALLPPWQRRLCFW